MRASHRFASGSANRTASFTAARSPVLQATTALPRHVNERRWSTCCPPASQPIPTSVRKHPRPSQYLGTRRSSRAANPSFVRLVGSPDLPRKLVRPRQRRLVSPLHVVPGGFRCDDRVSSSAIARSMIVCTCFSVVTCVAARATSAFLGFEAEALKAGAAGRVESSADTSRPCRSVAADRCTPLEPRRSR